MATNGSAMDSFILRGPGLGFCEAIADTIFMSKTLSDVDIICNRNNVIPAHKMFLGCSSLLREKFMMYPEEDKIYIKDMSRKTVCIVLKALYRNIAVVNNTELEECLRMIKNLEMEGFTWEPCEKGDTISISQPLDPQHTLTLTVPTMDADHISDLSASTLLLPTTTNNVSPRPSNHEPASNEEEQPPVPTDCSYCATKTCQDAQYFAHRMVAHNARINVCPCCPIYFEDIFELEVHVKEKHRNIYQLATEGIPENGPENAVVTSDTRCNICNLRIPLPTVVMHMFFKHRQPWLMRKCLLCKQSVDQLRTHLAEQHGIS